MQNADNHIVPEVAVRLLETSLVVTKNEEEESGCMYLYDGSPEQPTAWNDISLDAIEEVMGKVGQFYKDQLGDPLEILLDSYWA